MDREESVGNERQEACLHGALSGLEGLHDVGVAQVDGVHGLQGTAHGGGRRGRGKASARHKVRVGRGVVRDRDHG